MIGERICLAVVFAAEAAIAWFYYSSVYSAKRPQLTLSISFVLGYLFLFLLSIYAAPALNLLMFFFVDLILLIFNYKCSAKACILQAAFLTFSNGASEVLVNLILTAFSFDYNAYTYNFAVMLALVILSKLLYLVIVFLAAHIFKPHSNSQNDSSLTSLFCVMPVVSVFVVVTIAYIAMTSTLEQNTEILSAVSMLALLIVNLGVLILYGHIQTMAAENMALNISKAQDEAITDHYILMREHYDSQQIMIHDIKKHLAFIGDMLNIGDVAEAERYLEELETLPSLKRTVRLCDEPLLNVILSRYIAYSQDLGIEFHCNIRSSDVSFMDPTSIAALFSNLLSNAVESAQKSRDKQIELDIFKDADEGYIVISLENSCDSTPVADANGQLITTKKGREIHGYGLKSIGRVVERYDGMSMPDYDPEAKIFRYIIRFPLSKGT